MSKSNRTVTKDDLVERLKLALTQDDDFAAAVLIARIEALEFIFVEKLDEEKSQPDNDTADLH